MVGRKFAQPIAGNLERVVEASAKVLQRDRGGEFYELLGIEVAAQLGKQLVGNFNRRLGDLLGVLKAGLFDFGKVRARREVGEIAKLRLGNSLLSANGRADIYSERAANHLRRADAHQRFKLGRHRFDAQERLGQQAHRPQQLWPVGHDAKRRQLAPESPLHHKKERTDAPMELMVVQWFDAHNACLSTCKPPGVAEAAWQLEDDRNQGEENRGGEVDSKNLGRQMLEREVARGVRVEMEQRMEETGACGNCDHKHMAIGIAGREDQPETDWDVEGAGISHQMSVERASLGDARYQVVPVPRCQQHLQPIDQSHGTKNHDDRGHPAREVLTFSHQNASHCFLAIDHRTPMKIATCAGVLTL